MSDLKNKVGLYFVVIILGGYYGILPLFDIKVWERFDGWVLMSKEQALFNISISLIILFYLKGKKERK